jgi:hypothetical protein
MGDASMGRTQVTEAEAQALSDPRPDVVIRCPICRIESAAAMPADACVFFWDCPACGSLVRPKAGDCCVFCSYGSARCPFRGG